MKITRSKPPAHAKADARKLARDVATVVADELQRALTVGYYADTGQLRPPTDAGHAGYRTGHLARGIAAGKPTGSRTRATVMITVPQDRRDYVERVGNVLVLEGRVDALIGEQLEAAAEEVAKA